MNFLLEMGKPLGDDMPHTNLTILDFVPSIYCTNLENSTFESTHNQNLPDYNGKTPRPPTMVDIFIIIKYAALAVSK